MTAAKHPGKAWAAHVSRLVRIHDAGRRYGAIVGQAGDQVLVEFSTRVPEAVGLVAVGLARDGYRVEVGGQRVELADDDGWHTWRWETWLIVSRPA